MRCYDTLDEKKLYQSLIQNNPRPPDLILSITIDSELMASYIGSQTALTCSRFRPLTISDQSAKQISLDTLNEAGQVR